MTQKRYELSSPVEIAADAGKIIREHFGLASTGRGALSIAHMLAPAGWSEPFQRPEFDEYTLVVRGRKRIELEGRILELHSGQALLVRAGARVRYSNPYDAELEYWSVCIPAFSPETVHREPDSSGEASG